MKRTLSRILLAASALFAVTMPSAKAVPLSDLFSGGELIVSDKRFFDWSLDFVIATDPGGEPDFTLIDVLPLPDAVRPGIEFVANGQLAVSTPLDFLDVAFSFSVEPMATHAWIEGASLEVTAFDISSDSGLIAVAETISDALDVPLGMNSANVDPLFGIFDLVDTVSFDPQRLLRIEKNVLVSGDPLAFSELVSLDRFQQRFDQVTIPEPSPALLLIAGLLAIAANRIGARRGVTWRFA